MAPTARVDRLSQTLQLGRYIRSWRWTKYHYFYFLLGAGLRPL